MIIRNDKYSRASTVDRLVVNADVYDQVPEAVIGNGECTKLQTMDEQVSVRDKLLGPVKTRFTHRAHHINVSGLLRLPDSIPPLSS